MAPLLCFLLLPLLDLLLLTFLLCLRLLALP